MLIMFPQQLFFIVRINNWDLKVKTYRIFYNVSTTVNLMSELQLKVKTVKTHRLFCRSPLLMTA